MERGRPALNTFLVEIPITWSGTGTTYALDPADAKLGEMIHEILDANDAAVNFADFDNDGKAQAGVLVQRVNMSPLFVSQLITALQDNWSKYASKAMPKELFGDSVIDPDTIRPSHEDDDGGTAGGDAG